jgi:hypothetical protein
LKPAGYHNGVVAIWNRHNLSRRSIAEAFEAANKIGSPPPSSAHMSIATWEQKTNAVKKLRDHCQRIRGRALVLGLQNLEGTLT